MKQYLLLTTVTTGIISADDWFITFRFRDLNKPEFVLSYDDRVT